MIIRALTVRQPYASAMFFGPDPKDIENRSRKPPQDLIGKRLWIHAGEGLELDSLAFVRAMGFDPLGIGDAFDGDVETLSRKIRERRRAILRGAVENPLPHGVILGSVLLDDYTCLVAPARSAFSGGFVSSFRGSPWRDPSEEYGWILRDPQPLAVPIPVPGGGSLTLGWRPPDDIAALLIEQEFGRAA